MTGELLQTVEIEPREPARFAVIWLHGLGADGHDFPPIVPELGIDPRRAIRFVFPHAPKIPVTINGGMVMRAWYDIKEFNMRLMHDDRGVERSLDAVRKLIDREAQRGVAHERILLAGFSQGGAIAVHAALRAKQRVLGVVALSTYLVCEHKLLESLEPGNRGLPVFQAHGLHDPIVPIENGRAANEKLVELGYQVEWHAYPMQHQVCLEEIEALGKWIDARCAEADREQHRARS